MSGGVVSPEEGEDAGGGELEGGFSRRTVAWLAGVAGVSLLAALLVTAFGQQLGRPPDPGPTSWSVSALGHRGLAELLRGLEVEVAVKQTHYAPSSPSSSSSSSSPGVGRLGPWHALLLIEPDVEAMDGIRGIGGNGGRGVAGGRPALREAVDLARRRQAPLVLVLPKWRGEPLPEKPDWIGELRPLAPAAVMRAVTALGLPELAGLELRRAAPEAAGDLECKGWAGGPVPAIDLRQPQLLVDREGALEPVVSCRGGLLAGARRLGPDGPRLLVIADPDLLDNQGLDRAANADLVVALLTSWRGATGVVFDETIHGYTRSEGLLSEALSFPLGLATLQLALAGALLVWAGVGRFGKPLPAAAALPPGKEVLIDNTAKLLTLGGHLGDSLARYYRQTTRAVAAHFFLPPDLPESELRERLQEIARQRGLALDLAAVERAVMGRAPMVPMAPIAPMAPMTLVAPPAPMALKPSLLIAQRLHRWRRRMLEAR